MANYNSLLLYTWGDGNFTYSLDADNATYHLTSFDVDNPTDGDAGFVNAAVAAWSNVADINFSVDNSDPEIGFYEADMPISIGGRAYGINSLTGIRLSDVDVFINNDATTFVPFQTEKTQTYIHELGHALGLRHPNGDADDSDYNTYTTIMSKNEDFSRVPTTPMIYDIAAIQSMYGANNSYADGADIYTLGGTKEMSTIWDAGGVDTLKVADTETRDAVLDLRGGVNAAEEVNFSQLGNERVAIALDPNSNWTQAITIENATGGGGNDTLIGNSANNELIGGTGTDSYVFSGAHGNDTIVDSDGLGQLIVDGGAYSGTAKYVDANNWVLGDLNITKSGNDAVISKAGSSDSITVKDMITNDGALGITLGSGLVNFVFETVVNAFAVGGSVTTPLTISYYFDPDVPAQELSENFFSLQGLYTNIQGTITLGNETITFTDGSIQLNDSKGISGYALPFDSYHFSARLYNTAGAHQLLGHDVDTVNFYAADYGLTMLSGTNLPITPDFVAGVLHNTADISFDDGGQLSSIGMTNYAYTTEEYRTPFAISEGAAGGVSISGSAADDALNGGASDDYLYAQAGNDTVIAGDGDDTIVGGSGAGDDNYQGGNGEDIITYTSTLQGVVVDLESGTATGSEIDTDTLSGIEHVVGGDGNDHITGDDNNNRLEGLLGNDTLVGGFGSDTLIGGDGDDAYFFSSGDGIDTVIDEDGVGSLSVDGLVIQGTAQQTAVTSWVLTVGLDVFDLSKVANSLVISRSGTTDSITINNFDFEQTMFGITLDMGFSTQGTSSADTIGGGSGEDTLLGGSGDDTMLGGDGDDSIAGGAGSDSMDGGNGDDSIWGSEGNDTIIGGAGNDSLNGGINDDYIAGDADNDTLRGFSGNDELHGGDDDDTIYAGEDDDTVYGDDGDDYLNGEQGNDIILGGAGDDTMQGNEGDDLLLGGAGADAIYGHEGLDTISGGDDNDTIIGGDAADQLNGEAGDDRLYGGDSNDNLTGGDGNDYLKGEGGDNNLQGGAGNDTLYGGINADTLDGGTDIDRLFGDAGNDSITGGDAKDYLYGGAGNDTLRGGIGGDKLTGNAGDDVFAFYAQDTSTAAYDGITDFVVGEDLIDLRGTGYSNLVTSGGTDYGELRLSYSSTSDRTYVRSDQTTFQFYLDGEFTTSELTNDSFLFV